MQKKKGISLIVLVITIIVMLILASTIIISLNNNEVINNAQVAVDKTNEKQVQEIANTAWGEAYADGKREVSDLQTAVENSLKANDLNPEDYYIQVTEKGVTIKDINSVWIQKANRTVVKGDTVLNIGDTINYDETNGGTVTGLTNVDWKVLGAENGELLIMSATNVTSKSFNSEKTLEGGKDAYENGISELNEICEPYGMGANVTGARSITVEDVDRVTGYDKTQYDKGKIGAYGSIVTYSYNGTNRPAYSGSNGVTGTLSKAHSNGFLWYDLNNGYNYVSASALTNVENNGNELAKVKSTYYTYYASGSTDLKTAAPNAYNMLFGSSDGNYYWLASSNVGVNSDYVAIGLRCVGRGSVYGDNFVTSYGASNGLGHGVRAVVQLSSEYTPE